MEILFGGVLIDKEALKDEGINYPIKLEYYKRINEEKLTELEKAKYGIEIIKTEYQDKNIKVEKKEIKYLTNDERRIDFMLKTLKENSVTPIGLEDVICDLSKKLISCEL